MHWEAGGSMVHAALLYSSADAAARRLVPVVREAIDRNEAVMISLDEHMAAVLASGLGSRADEVTWVAAADRLVRPAAALGGLVEYIEAKLLAGATAVRSIGEVWLDGSDADAEWLRYEAAANEIFATAPLYATCLYPTTLRPDLLAAVRCAHPLLEADDDHRALAASPSWAGAGAACAHLPAPRLAPVRDPDLTLDRIADPRRARLAVSDVVSPGVRTPTSETLALIVSELVTNAIVHGDGSAAIALWLEPTYVVITVRDHGCGIADPFAGLRPPALPDRGAGLWVAHHLCDRISIDLPADGGTAVTVRVDRREN